MTDPWCPELKLSGRVRTARDEGRADRVEMEGVEMWEVSEDRGKNAWDVPAVVARDGEPAEVDERLDGGDLNVGGFDLYDDLVDE